MVSGSRLADSEREPDQVGEQDRDDPPLGGAPGAIDGSPAGPAAAVAAVAVAAPRFVPQVPQNLAPAGFAAPQFGQPPRADPHPMQKRPSDGLVAPQVGHITYVEINRRRSTTCSPTLPVVDRGSICPPS